MPNLTNKKVIIIVPYKDYSDPELEAVRETLGMFGAEIEIASHSLGNALGRSGGQIEVDLLLSDVDMSNYDAAVFIGGMGSIEYQENEQAHNIARTAISHNKLLAAICIAPIILARAGVLTHKKATVWSTKEESDTIDRLIKAGAKYVDQPVVVDGRIVTANGPEAAHDFANIIANIIA